MNDIEDLPTRTPRLPSTSIDEATSTLVVDQSVVAPDHLLPPPTGNSVLLGGPYEVNRLALEMHGKDIRLGRKIFALADEEDHKPVPVLETDRSVATPQYKQLLREASSSAHENKHLKEQAETNPVTGLPNRKAFNHVVHKIIQEGRGEDAAIAMLDLVDFKGVNDTYGHERGDELLRAFGEELKKVIRDTDTLIHFGGDEFVVVMPDFIRDEKEEMTTEERKLRMANRFRGAAAIVAKRIGASFGTSVGIGVSEPGDTPETWMHRADQEMYKDKRAPRSTETTDR